MSEETTMSAVVAMATAEFTTQELATLNNIAQMDLDPHGREFDYERIKHLFTQGGGTRMHLDTKTALGSVFLARLELDKR